MLTDMTSGRRRKLRLPFRTKVELAGRDGLLDEPCWSSDLSEGGVGLKASKLPVFTPVKVFLQIPDTSGGDRTVMLEGEIAWRRVGRTGVRFRDPVPERLRTFIKRQSAEILLLN
jgi:hypothetical protein